MTIFTLEQIVNILQREKDINPVLEIIKSTMTNGTFDIDLCYNIFSWCISNKQYGWAEKFSNMLISKGHIAGYFLYAFLLDYYANGSKDT